MISKLGRRFKFVIAATFALPTMFEVSWHHDFSSHALVILNFPVILFTLPNELRDAVLR